MCRHFDLFSRVSPSCHAKRRVAHFWVQVKIVKFKFQFIFIFNLSNIDWLRPPAHSGSSLKFKIVIYHPFFLAVYGFSIFWFSSLNLHNSLGDWNIFNTWNMDKTTTRLTRKRQKREDEFLLLLSFRSVRFASLHGMNEHKI